MLITQRQAHKKENSSTCTVWEYDFGNKELGFAIAHINGRFPERGKVMNHESNEGFYILEGTGVIHHETGDFEINPGDAFLCEKGKRYRIQGDNLKVTLSNSPAWSLQQFENIDD